MKERIIIKIIFSVLFSLIFAGCATIVTRVANPRNEFNTYYPATCFDGGMIAFPFVAIFGNPSGPESAYAGALGFVYGPFLLVFGLLDLPISVATDTLALPFDANSSSEIDKTNKTLKQQQNILPLTPEDINHFKTQFEQSGQKAFLLSDAETSILVSKINGPLKDKFTKDFTENGIWLFLNKNGFYFYRIGGQSEYLWINFGTSGHFLGNGSGDAPWLYHESK